jgi:hypothetical protein
MRHATAVLDGRLGRGGVQPAVDLQRIAADDLAVEAERELECQVRFSGARGPQDRQQPQRLR